MTTDGLGLIGLGNMGLPVARRLIACGRAVLAFDACVEPLNRAIKAGAKGAMSIQQIGAECRIIVLSLPTPDAVRHVMAELLAYVAAGCVIIDLSTNDPHTAQAMSQAAAARAVAYIDAPVSGGPSRAVTGELTLMIGGDEAAVQSVWLVLSDIGKQVEHVGSAGCGCIAKLLNNYVALWGMVGVSQAFLAASKMAISPDRLYEVMNKSSAQSYSLNRNFPKIRKGDFSPNFSIALADKDLRLALNLMNDAGFTPFAEKELRSLFAMTACADPDKDVAAIYETLESVNTDC
jgi:3-hydroxyisobutyrate dehydrogenase